MQKRNINSDFGMIMIKSNIDILAKMKLETFHMSNY